MSDKKERKTYSDDFKIAELNKLESYTAKEFKRLSEANGIDVQNLRNWAKSANIGPKTRLGQLATKTRGSNTDKKDNTNTGLSFSDLLLLTPEQQKTIKDGREDIAVLVKARDELQKQLDEKQVELDKKVAEIEEKYNNL